MVCTVYAVCTVCSLRFSITVVAWMRVKAVYAIWNRFHKQKFSGFRNPDYLTWGEILLWTNACNRVCFQLAEVFWSYISLCTAYGWNYPLSLGIQLINTLIVTSLDKFVLPGRNKHGINPPGSWEQANCSWLNKYGGRRRWSPVCSRLTKPVWSRQREKGKRVTLED